MNNETQQQTRTQKIVAREVAKERAEWQETVLEMQRQGQLLMDFAVNCHELIREHIAPDSAEFDAECDCGADDDNREYCPYLLVIKRVNNEKGLA